MGGAPRVLQTQVLWKIRKGTTHMGQNGWGEVSLKVVGFSLRIKDREELKMEYFKLGTYLSKVMKPALKITDLGNSKEMKLY